jgi:hypothetical protein
MSKPFVAQWGIIGCGCKFRFYPVLPALICSTQLWAVSSDPPAVVASCELIEGRDLV